MTSWREHALATKGFMPADEGDALHAAALAAAEAVPGAPFVEVGSYCGRSTIWLGDAARRSGTVVFAVDHHRGSEENQAGWEHHDPEVVDREAVGWTRCRIFRRALFDAGLEHDVVAVVGESPVVARPLVDAAALVFIDGGHGAEPARARLRGWARMSPAAARWRSTTCSPIRPTAAGRRTSRSTCRRSRVAASGCRR